MGVSKEEIKEVLEVDMKPMLAEQLPPKAMCIPITNNTVKFIETATEVMKEIVQE